MVNPRSLRYSTILVLLCFFHSSLTAGTRDVILLTTKNSHLKLFTFFEKNVNSELECAHLCVHEGYRCRSINFERQRSRSQGRCQLNNKTKKDNMEHFDSHSYYNYHEPYEPQNGVLIPFYQVNKNCADLHKNGARKDGIYSVTPDNQETIQVRCDMTTDGGGWTIFQRRLDGSVDFYRGWNDYKNAFGQMDGEYWLGLDKIHRLSDSGENVLRIDMEDFEGEHRYAQYGGFRIGNEQENYILHVRDYSGDAGDSLLYHNNMMFTTKDRDNDKNPDRSCAKRYHGAWWYNACHRSSLNGHYYGGSHSQTASGVDWYTWKGHNYSLKKTEMKFRPASF